MTGRTRRIIWIISSILLVCLTIAIWFLIARKPPPVPKSISITGVVLAKDPDPKKQVAVSNASIIADAGRANITTRSDPSGLFHFSFSIPPEENPPPISLYLQADEYQPLLLSNVASQRLLVAYMMPERSVSSQESTSGTLSTITGVSVRYTTKMTTTTNVGALVRTFEAVNTGDIPCAGNPVCSPDGSWKATVTPAVFEATSGNQFVNARISCIAGPCPFTLIDSDNLANPGSTIRVSVRNWSDTATFLVEAEVSRVIHGDVVRQSIPAIFGPALSFTLPPGGEGPSIQADLNGTTIVFPLGPDHRLTWATCTVQTVRGGTQVFRCELKPGYQFR